MEAQGESALGASAEPIPSSLQLLQRQKELTQRISFRSRPILVRVWDLIPLLVEMSSTTKEPLHFRNSETRRYHAIVIGGGVAGLVAAARLSEEAGKKILVIEAGVDRRGDPRIDTPGLFMSLWGDPDYDWAFYTESRVSDLPFWKERVSVEWPKLRIEHRPTSMEDKFLNREARFLEDPLR